MTKCKRINIPKPKTTETRPLTLPAMEDRIIGEILRRTIEPLLEGKSDNKSFGFRRLRSPNWVINYLLKRLRTEKYDYILEVDVKKFYDTIKQEKIKEILKEWNVPNGFIREITNILYSEKKNEPGKLMNGLPQGSPLSTCLANVIGDKIMTEFPMSEDWKKMTKEENATYLRYADDIVMLVKGKELTIKLKEELSQRLSIFGLVLNPEKTRTLENKEGTSFKAGGMNFTKKQNRWVVEIPKDKLERIKETKDQEELDGLLNAYRLDHRIGEWSIAEIPERNLNAYDLKDILELKKKNIELALQNKKRYTRKKETKKD